MIHAAGVSHNKANVKDPSDVETFYGNDTSDPIMFRVFLCIVLDTLTVEWEGYSGWDAEAQSAFELNADVIFNPCNGDTSAGRVRNSLSDSGCSQRTRPGKCEAGGCGKCRHT